jgi:opacity protein-like surface antigen
MIGMLRLVMFNLAYNGVDYNMKKQLIITLVVVLLICVGLSGCTNANSSIIGKWEANGEVWEFTKNNNVIFSDSGDYTIQGTYRFEDNQLVIEFGEGNDFWGLSGTSSRYEYEFPNQNELKLTHTTSGVSITFTRV